MEIGKRIKFHRNKLNISQEELADKVFVSRQSISNWENDKTYPDINSLVLLSKIFELTLDDLVKGDIEKMKETIEKTKATKEDVKIFNKLSLIYSIFLFIIVAIPYPLFYFSYKLGNSYYGYTLYFIIAVIGMFFAFKVEKYKKKHDIQTYREIIAFSEGKELSEIEKWKELGKRKYEKIVIVLIVFIFTVIVFVFYSYLFKSLGI